ncbi:restriction endonuclease subunit S [Sutterella wadsworthensis]|uniref:restriction endonuclease subunit S n=1 Tax=Sutterella wadsworthensis TaxID=40545 RepID=UPI00307CEE3A
MNSELLNLIENAPKVTLGDYIVRVERTNSAGAYGAEDVRGVSNTKGFMETRANIEGRSLKKFLVIEPFEFVFNRRTTRNGERLGLGFNMTDRAFILTEDYVAFHVKPEKDKELSPYFLYLYFLRDEFDRYVRSNSWDSATEFFNWDDMCRVKIPLPPIEVQRAYVDAYKGLTALIEENEALLKSLEATAQACVAECREKWPFVALRSYIRRLDKRNSDNSIKAVKGLSVTKQFREPSSKVDKTKLHNYKIVLRNQFAFVQTTNNEKCLVTCLSKFEYPIVVSSVNEVFEIVDTKKLLPEYLYLQFKRPEFDRYARFNSWGSARETFNWDDMCRVKIPLPPIEVQRAYVDAYKGLTALIEENEALLKSLEATAQACVAECREKWPMVALSGYIQELNDRNTDEKLKADAVRGISTNKEFIDTKADLKGVKLSAYKIVKPENFAFVADTSRRGDKMSLAFNGSDDRYLVSSISTVYEISKRDALLPEYLYLQFKRPEFDRYARFNSWGSARETFNWDDMCRVKIPLPPIEVQRAIVALYHCAEEARKNAEEAKIQLARVCPAMIQQASRRC